MYHPLIRRDKQKRFHLGAQFPLDMQSEESEGQESEAIDLTPLLPSAAFNVEGLVPQSSDTITCVADTLLRLRVFV